MWINDLVLINVQSISEQRIKLSKSINLFVGKNNSGKSTVIRSLLSFQNGALQDDNSLLRRFNAEGFIIAGLVDPEHTPFIESPIYKKFSKNAVVFSIHNKSYKWLKFDGDITNWKEYLLRGDRDGNIANFSKFPDNAPYNVFLPFLSKRKTQYFNGQFDEKSVKQIDYDFRNLATKLNKAKTNTYSDEFEKSCKEILSFSPNVLPGRDNMNTAQIGQYVGSDEYITIDNMGDGVIQIVGLLINLFQVKNKIFLIEEIENDLHPNALKKLLSLIINSSTDNQFMITTHSNIVVRVLGALEDTKIFETQSELIRDNDKRTQLFDTKLTEVNNSPEERIRILNDLGYELMDSFLYDGYIILEESSAEEIILNFLIPHFVKRLTGRIRTISAGGIGNVPQRFNNLHVHFLYTFKSEIYKKRAWVLVDGDVHGLATVEKLRTTFKNTDPKFFKAFAEDQFEKYYPEEYNINIEKISREPDRRKKGILKLELAKEIVRHYKSNPEEVAGKFERSAREVIEHLRSIAEELGGK